LDRSTKRGLPLPFHRAGLSALKRFFLTRILTGFDSGGYCGADEKARPLKSLLRTFGSLMS